MATSTDKPNAACSPEFPETRWTMVMSAGRESSPDSRRALTELCEQYWHPLYAYARRRAANLHEAQDLTQGFFAELLEKNYAGTATPQRGRFRGFLLTAFKHFMSKQWEKARAQKRGGGHVPISLDFKSADSGLQLEPAGGLTPEQLYDKQWGLTLLDRVMDRLQHDFESTGKSGQFEALKGFLIGDHPGQTYADVAVELSMTESAVKKAASRMRQRYRRLLREEIRQTVSCPEDVEDELRRLFTVLGMS
ncbi:MAG: sigma-70 family RNA polymerase sigma factor [Verrucomicrobiota bacterium]